MTIEELLQKPDAEILRVGLFVKQIVRAWHDITGQQPDACDCMLKTYLRTVRRYYSKINTMANKIYFDGAYYDIATITEEEKKTIKLQNPILYAKFAATYNWIVEKPLLAIKTRKKRTK
jgi:hypothetical protein